MPELLLELYTEEIPAMMQKNAESSYKEIFSKSFANAEISYESLGIFIGPRRLTLYINGLEGTCLAKNIILKGPKVSSPLPAIEGFCKANNITKNDLIVKEINSQEFYFYEYQTKERSVHEILPQILEKAIGEYVWPKSMYWGDYRLKWVRPLLNLMCILDGKILDMKYGHLEANNISFGHRFASYNSFVVSGWNDYLDRLAKSFVIPDRQVREALIRNSILEIEKKYSFKVSIEEELLEEVAGIVEFPKVLVGKISQKFMHLPSEVLITSMKNHQRYFPVRLENGEFAPYFIFVSNVPMDHDKEIIDGNEKVLSARLADAAYFYAQDQKIPLEQRVESLSKLVFHAKLGTIKDKTVRLVKIAEYLYPHNKDLAKSALLSKADLVTEMVGEFPELQGIIGSYYARLQGYNEEIVSAIRDHYKPLGGDDIPSGNAAFLSFIDKIDSLVGLMLAGERSTGSKDPYALRRYALGIIKIALSNNINANLNDLLEFCISLYNGTDHPQEIHKEILKFIEERLKHYLKEEYSYELINAIVDLSSEANISLIKNKLNILSDYLLSENGNILKEIYRRVSNILGNENIVPKIDVSKLVLDDEKSLYNVISDIGPKIESEVQAKNFQNALNHIASIQDMVNKFFDNVMVNDSDLIIAANRKSILKLISNMFKQIANFDHIIS